MKYIGILLVGLLVLTIQSRPAVADRALIVGVNFYQDEDISQLPGAAFDARVMSRIASEVFGLSDEHTTVLVGAEATKSNIERAFEEFLIGETEPGDRAIFYFSGHGVQVPDLDGDERDIDRLDEALVTASSRLVTDNPVPVSDIITDDRFRELLSQLEDRKTVLFVDSCHSGTISRNLQALSSKNADNRSKRIIVESVIEPQQNFSELEVSLHQTQSTLVDSDAGLAVWSAAASAQLAYEDVFGGVRRSVFTLALEQGLLNGDADQNADERISGLELHQYISKFSKEYCDSRDLCPVLTPTLEASTDYKLADVRTGLTDTASTEQNRPEVSLSGGNDAELKLEISSKGRIKLGQFIRFRASSSQDGYLTILTSRPDGSLMQLFPNDRVKGYGTDGQIFADRPLIVPDKSWGFGFQADQSGKAVLIALLTDGPNILGEVVFKQMHLDPVSDPEAHIATIVDQLSTTILSSDPEKDHANPNWSMTTLDYFVE